MHQGAVGLRGGVRARIGVGTSAPSPTPSPNHHGQTLSHSQSSQSVTQSVRQGSRAVGQAQLVGWQGMCSPPVLLHSPSAAQWVVSVGV